MTYADTVRWQLGANTQYPEAEWKVLPEELRGGCTIVAYTDEHFVVSVFVPDPTDDTVVDIVRRMANAIGEWLRG